MWSDLVSVESFFSPFLLRSDERLLFLLSTSADLDLRRLSLSLDLLRFLGATTLSLDLLLLAFRLPGDGLEALRAAQAFKSAGRDPILPSLVDSFSLDFLPESWNTTLSPRCPPGPQFYLLAQPVLQRLPLARTASSSSHWTQPLSDRLPGRTEHRWEVRERSYWNTEIRLYLFLSELTPRDIFIRLA